MKYGTAELKVPAVVMAQIDTTADSTSLTTDGEQMQTLDIVRGQLEMPTVASQPRGCQMRLGSEKPQSNILITVFSRDPATNLTPLQHAKLVELVSYYPCMKHR